MIDASELVLYESLVKSKMSEIYIKNALIQRIALHPMLSAPPNTFYKKQRYSFRIAYKIEGDLDGWCISCMGGKRYLDDPREVYCGGKSIGEGTFLEAVQWLIDGENR